MNLNGTVLLVDDDAQVSATLVRALSAHGVKSRMQSFVSGEAALSAIEKLAPIDVAILDLSIEPLRGVESGFELLGKFREHTPETRIIVLTGNGADEHGIRALRLGAASFLEKPADPAHIAALVADGVAQARLTRRVRELENRAGSRVGDNIVGESNEAKKLRADLDFLASNSLNVFIKGETGVGKSAFVTALHSAGLKAGTTTGRLVSYAPRAGGGDLISSDLFGHVKGAFTGATENRPGLFAHAANGILFLDEVDELPSEVQVTLLTVLQERQYRAVGSAKVEQFTGRVIAATNANVEESLASGKLREDLYHRLAQELVEIPALRARRGDIPLIAKAALLEFNRRDGSTVFEIEPEVIAALTRYDWPGNVRELRNVIERGAARAAYARRTAVLLADLPDTFRRGPGSECNSEASSFSEQVEQFKLQLIEAALKKCGGNQVRAAESLGMDRSLMRRIYARKSS
jgi:DNA-binding NtrC family response regulator